VKIAKEGLQLLSRIDKSENLKFLEKITEEEAKTLSDILDKIR